jgi:hypothetical protein
MNAATNGLSGLPPQDSHGVAQGMKANQKPSEQDTAIAGLGVKTMNHSTDSQSKVLKDKGSVIILTGIVASGKSSIVKAVQKVDPGFYEEDLDLRRDPKTPTTDQMEIAMIDDTINRSLAGEKTIIGLMKADAFTQRMLQRGISGIPIKKILVHCPFSEIPSRLEARNSAAEAPGGNPENWRDPLVPIDQFAQLYKQKEKGIEEIDRFQAIEFFNTSFDKMIVHAKKVGNPLPPDEQIAIDKVEGLDIFLKQLGFTDQTQTKISVAPREAYDVILDTSKCRDEASREAAVVKILHG